MARRTIALGSLVLLGALCSCTALLGDFTVDPTATPEGDAGDSGVADVATDDDSDSGDGAAAPFFRGARHVTAGIRHTCALDGNGEVYCWGDNRDGQIAQPDLLQSVPRPKKIALPGRAAQVVAGSFHTCAIMGDSAMYCWGRNACGQTGAGDTNTPAREPRAVKTTGGTFQWVHVAPGLDHTCANESGGATYCWGCNARGQAGLGIPQGSPASVATNAGADKGPYAGPIAASAAHTCAAAANAAGLACWGTEDVGQLGNGPPESDSSAAAVAVVVPSQVRLLALGERHSCALDANENVSCWGDNQFGQLGMLTDGGAFVTAPSGRAAGGAKTFVAANGATTCFILMQGQVVACAGNNAVGQLGRGNVDNSPHPIPQPVLAPGGSGAPLSATHIGVGREHACAVTAGGEIACWGRNTDGQLGDGTTGGPPQATAIRVMPAE